MSNREILTDLLAEHRFLDHRSSFGDKCYCGWTSQDEPHAQHAADVVLAAFTLVCFKEA